MLYTDGNDLFNQDHLPVFGSAGLVSGGGGGQPNLILPMPGDTQRAVVFRKIVSSTIDYCGYITVDMALDGGLGGTTDTETHRFMDYPHIPSGQLTAVPHNNGMDYWVLLHERGTDAFYSFQLTAQGLDTVPVISHTGPVTPMEHYGGTMLASYQGDRIAFTAHAAGYPPSGDSSEVAIFNFDPNTGVIEFICDLPEFIKPQTAEFSPLGSKLYVSEQYSPPGQIMHELWQYDLTNLDCSDIQASKSLVFRDSTQAGHLNSYRVLGLAPDGKIYHRHFWTQGYLGVVNDPEATGAACGYVRDGFLTMNDTLRGLTNQCKRYHDSDSPWTGVREEPTAVGMELWPVPLHDQGWLRLDPGVVFDELQWIDGLGRCVRHQRTAPVNGLPIDRGTLPSGVFAIRILRNSRAVGALRVVVE